jgi:hypothetical protein
MAQTISWVKATIRPYSHKQVLVITMLHMILKVMIQHGNEGAGLAPATFMTLNISESYPDRRNFPLCNEIPTSVYEIVLFRRLTLLVWLGVVEYTASSDSLCLHPLCILFFSFLENYDETLHHRLCNWTFRLHVCQREFGTSKFRLRTPHRFRPRCLCR